MAIPFLNPVTFEGLVTVNADLVLPEAGGGNLGVGTDSPVRKLTVWDIDEVVRIVSSAGEGRNHIAFWDQDAGGTGVNLGFFGYPYANGTFSMGTKRSALVEIIVNNVPHVYFQTNGESRFFGTASDNTNVAYTSFYRRDYATRQGYIGEIGDAGNIHLRSEAGLRLNAVNDLQFNNNVVHHQGIFPVLMSMTPAAGDVLMWDGVDSRWESAPPDSVVPMGFQEHKHTVSANQTVDSGNNAISAGPVTISDGFSVTVADGSVWTVV